MSKGGFKFFDCAICQSLSCEPTFDTLIKIMNKKRDETFNNEKERVKQYGKRKNYQKRNSHCLEHDAGGNPGV